MARKTIADYEKEAAESTLREEALTKELSDNKEVEEKRLADAELDKELDATGDENPTEDKHELMTELEASKTRGAELTKKIEGMADRDFRPVNGRIAGSPHILVQTPDEYRVSSAERGLVMGRDPKQKTICSIEELRALINSNWTPSMIMEKHGMTQEDFKQLVWKLSLEELRKNPIKYSIERDMFDRGA